MRESNGMYFFSNKIKEIFSFSYALRLLSSEDGFIFNKPNPKQFIQNNIESPRKYKVDDENGNSKKHQYLSDEKALDFNRRKKHFRESNSYFKLHVVELLYDLFFTKSYLSTIKLDEDYRSILFLMEFESFRFKIMNFQTEFISYPVFYNMFESSQDIYPSYLMNFLESNFFRKGLEDEVLKENYKQMESQSSFKSSSTKNKTNF